MPPPSLQALLLALSLLRATLSWTVAIAPSPPAMALVLIRFLCPPRAPAGMTRAGGAVAAGPAVAVAVAEAGGLFVQVHAVALSGTTREGCWWRRPSTPHLPGR